MSKYMSDYNYDINNCINNSCYTSNFTNYLYIALIICTTIITIILIVNTTGTNESTNGETPKKIPTSIWDFIGIDTNIYKSLFGTSIVLSVISIILMISASKIKFALWLLLSISMAKTILNAIVLEYVDKSGGKLKLYLAAHIFNAITLFYNLVQVSI